MTVRGKFQVQGRKRVSWSPSGEEVTFSASYDPSIPEDQKYAKATPTAQITMFVDNPAALAVLELGKFFYVDFVPVEPT